MLQTKSVDKKLLELLEKIMAEPLFDSFVLVGGTSLALQIGHRVSVDIDLFGNSAVLEIDFLEKLKEFGTTVVLKKSSNILICSVDGIKVDFVNYGYPLIGDVQINHQIRLASLEDISAMKLNAIAGRGCKKDFVDIYYLLKTFSLEQMIGFYLEKYSDGSEFMVRKSLTYFEDADKEIDPIMFDKVNWDTIKATILACQ
jgi:predicted nucleotidyltransferase component of viral defense system